MRRRKSTPTPSLSGRKWRETHQATVDAILGSGVRTVRSQGTQFFNKDNWTGRAFLSHVSEWARLNPGKTPDRYDVMGWVQAANQGLISSWEKTITIAATPDDLPRWLAMALVGGGYHEAWHTEYSRNTPVNLNEVWPNILDYWSLIPYDLANGKRGWAGLVGALMQWSNLIEDIRIERRGCEKYPGAPEKMEALQDLILKMELEGRTAAEDKGLTTANDHLSVVMGTFRDLGLGYDTVRQGEALRSYAERSPEAFEFVTKGKLRPLLNQAINLSAADDMGCIWLAMEVVAEIAQVAGTPPEPPPKGSSGQEKPPQPKQPPQNTDYEGDPEENAEGGGEKPLGLTYKVGQRAKLTAGPYKGRVVEVTRAGIPDPVTGDQALEFALVEDE